MLELLAILSFSFPGGEYLAIPWDWFLSLSITMRVVVLVFGGLGLYLLLRLFYIIVEAIMGIFQ